MHTTGAVKVEDKEIIDFVMRENLVRPFYFVNTKIDLTSRVRTEENLRMYSLIGSHQIVGGESLETAEEELVKALAIHQLLKTIDGEKASLFIPLRIDKINEVPMKENGIFKKVDIEGYLTSPQYLAKKELLAIAYEARFLALGSTQGGIRGIIEEYINLLWEEKWESVLSNPQNRELIERVKSAIGNLVNLGMLVKLCDTDLRVSTAFRGIFGHPFITQELEEYFPYYKEQEISNIDKMLAYIYAQYNRQFNKPINTGFEAREILEEIYNYLALVYDRNRETVDYIDRVFTENLIRTVGAAHGREGVFYMRNGISGRDVSVKGEINDVADVYLPEYDKELMIDIEKLRKDDLLCIATTLAEFRSILYGREVKPSEIYDKEAGWQDKAAQLTYENYYKKAKEITE